MNKGYNWEPTYMYFCKNLYCMTIKRAGIASETETTTHTRSTATK